MPNINRGNGGNNIKIFGFHLYGKSDTPTSPVAGDIWIKTHDISEFTNVVLDEAIRVTYGNKYLMLIVDDTSNGYESITQNKKSVSGSNVIFTSLRESNTNDSLPWQCSNLNKLGNVIDIKRKYPLVYSRLNDLLDIETAYVYDGTQWNSLCEQGNYLICQVGTTSPSLHIYNRSVSDLILHSDIAVTLPSVPNSIDISDDKSLIVLFDSTNNTWAKKITVLTRTGDNFSVVTSSIPDPIGNEYDRTYSARLSHDKNYLAISAYPYDSGCTYPSIYLYKRNADNTYTFLQTKRVKSTNGFNESYDLRWSHDDNYIFMVVEYATGGWYDGVFAIHRTNDTLDIVSYTDISFSSNYNYRSFGLSDDSKVLVIHTHVYLLKEDTTTHTISIDKTLTTSSSITAYGDGAISKFIKGTYKFVITNSSKIGICECDITAGTVSLLKEIPMYGGQYVYVNEAGNSIITTGTTGATVINVDSDFNILSVKSITDTIYSAAIM